MRKAHEVNRNRSLSENSKTPKLMKAPMEGPSVHESCCLGMFRSMNHSFINFHNMGKVSAIKVFQKATNFNRDSDIQFAPLR